MSLPFHRYGNFGFLVLRVIVGAVFIYHGYMKWGMWTAASTSITTAMLIVFKILSVAEPLAGLALIIGVMTEYAALGLVIDMLGAMYFKSMVMHVAFSAGTSTGWEFDLVLLGAVVFLMLNGGGALALQSNDE